MEAGHGRSFIATLTTFIEYSAAVSSHSSFLLIAFPPSIRDAIDEMMRTIVSLL